MAYTFIFRGLEIRCDTVQELAAAVNSLLPQPDGANQPQKLLGQPYTSSNPASITSTPTGSGDRYQPPHDHALSTKRILRTPPLPRWFEPPSTEDLSSKAVGERILTAIAAVKAAGSTGVSSEKIAEILGVGTKGIGSRLFTAARYLAPHDLDMSQVMESKKTADGSKLWVPGERINDGIKLISNGLHGGATK